MTVGSETCISERINIFPTILQLHSGLFAVLLAKDNNEEAMCSLHTKRSSHLLFKCSPCSQSQTKTARHCQTKEEHLHGSGKIKTSEAPKQASKKVSNELLWTASAEHKYCCYIEAGNVYCPDVHKAALVNPICRMQAYRKAISSFSRLLLFA